MGHEHGARGSACGEARRRGRRGGGGSARGRGWDRDGGAMSRAPNNGPAANWAREAGGHGGGRGRRKIGDCEGEREESRRFSTKMQQQRLPTPDWSAARSVCSWRTARISCLAAFCPSFCLGRGRGAEPALPNPAGQGVGARRRTAGRRAGQGVKDCGRRSGCASPLLPPCQAMSEARACCIVSRCRFRTSARHCGQQKRGFRAGPAADKSADAGIDR